MHRSYGDGGVHHYVVEDMRRQREKDRGIAQYYSSIWRRKYRVCRELRSTTMKTKALGVKVHVLVI